MYTRVACVFTSALIVCIELGRIIQTWVETSNKLPKKLLDLGYELIMSTKNAWYFDHGFWGVTKYYTWKMAYDNKILLQKGVLGGEACVWTELIDENNLGICISKSYNLNYHSIGEYLIFKKQATILKIIFLKKSISNPSSMLF